MFPGRSPSQGLTEASEPQLPSCVLEAQHPQKLATEMHPLPLSSGTDTRSRGELRDFLRVPVGTEWIVMWQVPRRDERESVK